MKFDNGIKIGLIPLYLELYDDLDPDLRYSFLPVINKIRQVLAEQGEVIESPIISKPSEIDNLIDHFNSESVEVIVTFHLSYSPSLLIADALKKLQKPLIIISTSVSRSFQDMSDAYLLQNHGIHGVMDLASVLQSMGLSFKIVSGYYQDSEFINDLTKSVQIIKAVKEFKNQRIGQTGVPFPMMGDFSISYEYLNSAFGIQVISIPEKMILQKQSIIEEKKYEDIMSNDRMSFDIISSGQDTHKNSVLQYLALHQILDEQNISAYTMEYLDCKEAAVPFYAVSRLMTEGFGYAGEGDVLTASLGRPLNVLAGKAMFSEMFCPDWSDNLIIMSHMGESDSRFANPEIRGQLVEKNAFGNKLKSLYHRFRFQPGTVTFAAFAKTRPTGLKLVIGLLDIIDLPLFDCFKAPHYIVKPRMPLPEFLEKYSLSGGGHHLYIADGDIVNLIEAWSRALGIETAEISPN